MNRRKFIKTILTGAGACVVPGAVIRKIATKSNVTNLIFHKDAFSLCIPPLKIADEFETSGIAIATRQAEAIRIYNGINNKIYKENIEKYIEMNSKEILNIIPEIYDKKRIIKDMICP